tara:strand:+ start:330 stop:1358 length:1029 start_codon:yes stop_codon:yes gene_type:complete
MKLTFRQIEPFVKNPDPKARAVLLYGPDAGLATERMQIMAKTIVTDLNDPFNVSKFAATDLSDNPAKLDEEARAISMMGGGRVVIVNDASDKYNSIFKGYLEDPSAETLVLVVAGDLGPKSSLRLLFEKQDNAAALPCYVAEGQDLARQIQDHLRSQGFQLEPDAAHYLTENLVGDQAQMRSELEKLITYMGQEKTIRLADAQANTGNLSEQKLDALVYGCLGGQMDRADSLLQGLYSEGVSGVYIIRAFQNHLRMLLDARLRRNKGQDMRAITKSLRIFFKLERAFAAQLDVWNEARILNAIEKLNQLEAEIKQTGAPEQTLLARALMGLARMSARRPHAA